MPHVPDNSPMLLAVAAASTSEVLVNATRNVANVAVYEGILVVSYAFNQEAVMADYQKRSRPRKSSRSSGQACRIQVVPGSEYQHVWLFQKDAQKR